MLNLFLFCNKSIYYIYYYIYSKIKGYLYLSQQTVLYAQLIILGLLTFCTFGVHKCDVCISVVDVCVPIAFEEYNVSILYFANQPTLSACELKKEIKNFANHL